MELEDEEPKVGIRATYERRWGVITRIAALLAVEGISEREWRPGWRRCHFGKRVIVISLRRCKGGLAIVGLEII